MRRLHHPTIEGPHKNSQWSHIPVTFDNTDLKLKDYPHTDAMVIETNLASWAVTRILVNTSNSVDILFSSTFDNMKLERKLLQLAGRPLYGFGGKQVKAIGNITLPVTFRDQNNSRTEHITFDMVDMLYNYNTIFGRGVTNIFSAALHPGYLCMKLLSAKGIIAIYGNQDLARIVEETATLGQKNVQNLNKEKPKAKDPSHDELEQQT
ncbi:uncharacterized protein [Miscanthus floridulus]|uniref:uncharacterized protein n=1 Tax=Miscanthus floridulus TaxID=154761 RepID=UPI003458359C